MWGVDPPDCLTLVLSLKGPVPVTCVVSGSALVQVTGLDGNYRITCHTVMEVLREHKDSVMAVLEAFVYDPLLNWRLMDSEY